MVVVQNSMGTDVNKYQKIKKEQNMHILSTILSVIMVLSLFFQINGLCEDKLPIRICYPNKAQYAPFVVAKQQDAWRKNGVEVKDIALAGGGIDAAEAFMAGEADIAVMGDVPALIVLSKDERLKIIARYMTSEHMHRIVVSGSSNIKKPSDLIGKKIAVQAGTSTNGALLLYLKKNGIDKKDVNIIPISPQFFQEAMQRGEIDAMAGSEPWPQNVLDKNSGSYQMTTMAGLGSNYPHVMLARENFLKKHPEEVKAIIETIAEAEKMLMEKPQEAAELMAKSTGRAAKKELDAFSEIKWELGMDETVEKSLTQTAEFLLSEGKIKKLPDIKKALQQ